MTIREKIAWHVKNWKRNYREKRVPSYEEKRQIILSYQEQFKTNILLETGTFLGDTVEQFKHDFERIISIELSHDLAMRAADRFKNQPHIEIVEGDSGKLLPGLLQTIDRPVFFWLDGHYSSEFFIGEEYFVTAKGEKHTPIIEELQAVLTHPVKGHVILIDDARCFTGEKDYPSISELRKLVKGFSPRSGFSISRDIIRITPN